MVSKYFKLFVDTLDWWTSYRTSSYSMNMFTVPDMCNIFKNIFVTYHYFLVFSTNVGTWRLADGSNSLQGRLEFKFKYETNWHSISTNIVPSLLDRICKHLGFATFLTYFSSRKFGRGTTTGYHLRMAETITSKEINIHDLGLQCIMGKSACPIR